MDYANIYTGAKLKKFDGANNLQQKHIKYGDALAAIAYAHDISRDAIVAQWPLVGKNERWCGGSVTDQLEFIKQHKTRTPKRVLEIGSGRGEVTGFLCELGYSVTSVEPSVDAHSLHNQTHQQLFGKTYDYELLNLSVHQLDIDYSQFDTIIMVESLEHILAEHWDPQWEKICAEFQGYFCVTNWLAYHPIAVGQYASRDMHCRLVNDELYDTYCAAGNVLVRDRSHLCVML
jgi:SAM-dependent methyltransferase